MKLHWQILLAIALAIPVGLVTGPNDTLLGAPLLSVYSFIGTLFLNALKMVIVPLIVSSIIASMGTLGSSENFGRLGLKTLSYYALTSLIAILIGLFLVNLTRPGIVNGVSINEYLDLSGSAGEVQGQLATVEARGIGDVFDIFIRMVPPNIVTAAAEGQMLGLIFFSMLFGFFMSRIDTPFRDNLQNFWQGVSDTMVGITLFIMRFAPVGVFGLIARTVSTTGFQAFEPVLVFLFTALAALLIHGFVALPLLMISLGRLHPLRHFRAMAPAMLTAFSTASSSATLPLTMECAEERAGVSRKTSSFVLPLGATVNMDGTALYECVAAMFIAQAYGLELGFSTQFVIVLVALLTSIGVAGIPAASLVAITIILSAVGLPLEGIGLLLITDRVLDMVRTSINVFSDSCGAVIIARSEGEDVLTDNSAKL